MKFYKNNILISYFGVIKGILKFNIKILPPPPPPQKVLFNII